MRLILESQKSRDRISTLERNFETRERQLLGEIEQMMREKNELANAGNDGPAPSVKKYVQNVKLKSEIKYCDGNARNKEMAMGQILEAMKSNKIKSKLK